MRFTIRDIIWLTLVVALAMAWWVDHDQQWREILRLIDLAQHETRDVQGEEVKLSESP